MPLFEAYDPGKWLEATYKYKEAVTKQPDCPEGHHKLGRAYATRGRHCQAIEALEKAVELGLETAAIHREIALSYRERGEYEKALRHAEQALQLEPGNALHYDLAGQLRADDKKYAKALDYYRYALRKDQRFTNAHLHLASALKELDRGEDALEELIKALRINADGMDWEMLGQLLQAPQGNTARIKAISNVLPIEPSVWVRWGRTLHKHVSAKEIGREALMHALKLACEVKDNLSGASGQAGVRPLALVKLAGQLRHLRLRCLAHPNSAAAGDVVGSRAKAQLRSAEETEKVLDSLDEDVVDALCELDASLGDMPDSKPLEEKIAALLARFGRLKPYGCWASILFGRKKLYSALALTVDGLRLPQASRFADFLLSWVEMGLPERLVTELGRAVEELNDESVDLAWARVLLDKLERYADAERILRRTIKGNGKLPSAHDALAVACARQQKHDDAYAALTRALELRAKQGLPTEDIKEVVRVLKQMSPALSRNRLERLQRISELVDQINQEAWFVGWARFLIELGEVGLALVQLQAAVERAYEVPDDVLDSVLFGKDEAKQGSSYDRVDRWAGSLEKHNNRKGLIQLGRVLKGYDKQRALRHVREAIEGTGADDAVWLEAGSVFGELGVPAEALSCYRHYLIEGRGRYDYNASWVYSEWENALMSADRSEKNMGHIAVLIDAVKSWTEDAESRNKIPKVNWDELLERRAAQERRIDELVETLCQNVDEHWACYQLAERLYNHREYAAAIRVLQHAADLNPRDAQAAHLMGWSLIQSNRVVEARSEFRRALNLASPPKWWMHAGMAEAHLRSNDIMNAGRCYERAVDLLSKDPASDPASRSQVYESWALALTDAGKLDDALEKAKLSQEMEDNMWSNFRLGHVCYKMRRYDDALEYYEKAKQRGDHPYPSNNIANTYQGLGRYGVARKLWGEACIAYHKGLAKAIEDRNAEYLFYYGDVQVTLGNESVSEMLYRIGLQLDPTHTGILTKLGSLYMELKRRAENAEARGRFQSLARHCWNKAETILKERHVRDGDVETLINLGYLYLEMADDEHALESFSQAREIRSKDFRVQTGMGETYRRAGRRREAIRHLKHAVSELPDDLDVKTKLARVYLEAEQLDAAEKEFCDVLDRSESHFEARVGLGEVYVAMAEKRSKDKETEAAGDFWRRAQDELKRAIATAEERPKDISDQERAPVHYLLGYCQVSQYPTVPRFRQREMLREAKLQFEISHSLDRTDKKAERAREKVKDKMKRFPPDRPAELIGPVVVVAIALVLLIVAQMAKFNGWQEPGRPEFKLTEVALTKMPTLAQGPEAVFKELLNKLKPAFDKTFADKDSFLAHLTELAGGQGVAQYGEALAQYAFVPWAPKRSYLSEGGWVLLTLGAVLLLIAGLYLPYLTSLKVGPLHLEKSMAEQVGAGSALGITVEQMTREATMRK